jgi:hypothetical protein
MSVAPHFDGGIVVEEKTVAHWPCEPVGDEFIWTRRELACLNPRHVLRAASAAPPFWIDLSRPQR